jgi:hypothetical protein
MKQISTKNQILTKNLMEGIFNSTTLVKFPTEYLNNSNSLNFEKFDRLI